MKKLMEKALKRAMGSKKENGKKGLKGFTLVEIIVVLVILAILAAAMIPALTGYIDKARDKTIISEARSALTAAQTIASEEYAKSATDESIKDTIESDAKELSEVPGTISGVKVEKGKVKELTYVNKDNTKKVEYKDNKWGDVKPAS